MSARRVRRWLRAANALLASGIVAVGAALALSASLPSSDSVSPQFDSTLRVPSGSSAQRTVSEAEFKRFSASLGRRDQVVPVPIPRPPEPDDPLAPLPLRLFRVVSLSHDSSGAGRDVVGLSSKDPSRPESFALGVDETVHGVRLLAVERGEGLARVTVARGADRFTYPFVLPSNGARSPAIAASRGPASPDARDLSPAANPKASPSPGPGLRLVGYLGSNGEPSGVRVTGIEPASSFATAGVRRGDAILEFDGRRIASASAFSKRWSEGWRPIEALILALDQPGSKPIRIRFGT